jgi:hypothetical protein
MFSWQNRSTFIVGVAVAIAGAWGVRWLGPSPNPSPLVVPGPGGSGTTAGGPQEIEELLKESRISFADWQALVKQTVGLDQRRQIFERYRGARVTWRGYFDMVNPIRAEYDASRAGDFLLVMYESRQTLESQALGRAPALCIFPGESSDGLQELQRGAEIVVQGTFAAERLHGELLGTRLYDCRLIAP